MNMSYWAYMEAMCRVTVQTMLGGRLTPSKMDRQAEADRLMEPYRRSDMVVEAEAAEKEAKAQANNRSME